MSDTANNSGCERAMKAAIALLDMTPGLTWKVASTDFGVDGFIEVSSFETTADLIPEIFMVIEAMKPFMCEENSRWQWRCFASDGIVRMDALGGTM